MELYGHAAAFYYALREYLPKESAEHLVKLQVAKLSLTDTIRYLVRKTASHPEIVNFGRGYSHFTDGCGMRLPIGETLKTLECIDRTDMVADEDYVSKFADKPTDFKLFFELNLHLFGDNITWGLAVLAHLNQDVGSDAMWQHNLCRCITAKNEVVYVLSGRTVTGKEFREDMALANIWCHRFFNKLIKERFGDEITQSWIDENVCQAYYQAYSEGMAKNSCKYLAMDEGVFSESDEIANGVIKTLIQHGLIRSESNLELEAKKLFYGAVAACNSLVNHLARL